MSEVGYDESVQTCQQYEVLISFTDKYGGVYWQGQKYPLVGYSPTPEWIEYLMSDKNRFGEPVIG